MTDDTPDLPDPELEALERLAFDLGDGDEVVETDGEEPSAPDGEATEELFEPPLDRLRKDFDNYRRRVEKERHEWESEGAGRAILALLPVLDHLELALDHAEPDAQGGSFRHGVALIRDQFLRSLEGLGLTRIAAVGAPFDPHLHEAVATAAAEGIPAGNVIREVRAGFLSGDRVLRPTRVVVAE